MSLCPVQIYLILDKDKLLRIQLRTTIMNLLSQNYLFKMHIVYHKTSVIFYDDLLQLATEFLFTIDILDKVFKNGQSEICGRQPLKHLKWYDLLCTHVLLFIHFLILRRIAKAPPTWLITLINWLFAIESKMFFFLIIWVR